MFFLSRKGMRFLLMVSGALFLFGVMMQMLLNVLQPEMIPGQSYLPSIAFLLILIGPVILLATVVVALVSGENKKMDPYQQ